MNRSMPPSFWLVLAGLCFAGALASWPRPRAPWAAHEVTTTAPNAAVAPAQTAQNGDAATAGAGTEPAAVPAGPRTLPDLPDERADGAALPQAGRQVLRCVEGGRTVYRDATSACAEGPGEAVTLFPTRGVEAPR